MNFKYTLTKKDYEKIVYEKNKKTNIIYIILLSMVFLLFTLNLIIDYPLIIFIIYLIYVAFIAGILFISNKLITKLIVKLNEQNIGIKYGTYNIKITKNKIIEEIDDLKHEISFNDIRKIKYNKNSIIVYQKSKLVSLTFKKSLFEDTQMFDKLKQILKEKVIITK